VDLMQQRVFFIVVIDLHVCKETRDILDHLSDHHVFKADAVG
jgi:hypothetical protein